MLALANGSKIYSGLVDCIRYQSHWFWPPLLSLSHTHIRSAFWNVLNSMCFYAFVWNSNGTMNVCTSARWLLYFALRSIESMNKNQTAVHVALFSRYVSAQIMSIALREEGKLEWWQKRWHSKTLCLFSTYNRRGVHEHKRVKRKEGETFKRCLISV